MFLCLWIGEGDFDVVKHECLDVVCLVIGCGEGESEVFWSACFCVVGVDVG